MEHDSARIFAFRRNLVLAASAGTGKTHSLVGVLVHLLMGASELGGAGLHAPVDAGRIVATTFSRKAAAEIRARLVGELERLVNADAASKYAADLDGARVRAGQAIWSDREKRERARTALDGIPRAQIGTLHSFASSIARRFALELGLSPGFDLADEEESRERTLSAIERVVASKATSSGVSDGGLRELAKASGGEDRLIARIERLLARLDEDGRGAALLEVDDRDADVIDARMRELILCVRAASADAKLAPLAHDVLSAWETKNAAALFDATTELLSLAKNASKSPAAVALFEYRDALPRASADDNAEVARKLVAAWLARDRFAPLARDARALLAECELEIRKGSERDSVLGFGQILRAARDVLRDHPNAARDLGGEIDALLVDEFQDTSRLQRDLVVLVWECHPSARKAGALAKLGDVRHEGLFVVGDRKQSIYGFRGADVGVFAELCVGLAGGPAREALGIAEGAAWEPKAPLADFIPLRHNRRSTQEILTFVNAFSARRLRARGGEPALYEIAYASAIEDLIAPPGATPSFQATQSTRPAELTKWLRLPAPRGSTTRLAEAFAIAHRVRKLVAADNLEASRGALAPRFRDMAVLAHTNAMLDACAFAFAQANIPFVVAGSGFYSAREVKDVVAMLGAIVDPNDTLALLTVLRGPWASVRDETLIALTDRSRGLAPPSRWGSGEGSGEDSRDDSGERRALVHPEDHEALRRVRFVLEALRCNVDRMDASELLREAVRELGLEEVLIQLPRGVQRVANVRKVLGMAKHAASARAFLERVRDAAEREAKETEAATFSDEDDAVRLLTIHASKGLDFPIVFVPEVGATTTASDMGAIALDVGTGDGAARLSARACVEVPGGVGGQLRVDPPSYTRAVEEQRRRDHAERARLAYVAATRAARALFFIGDRKPPKGDASDAYTRTTAAALAELASSDAVCEASMLDVEDAPASAVFAALPERGALGVAPPPPPLETMPFGQWRTLPIATTSLQDFAHCPRRFQLLHVLDLPEGDAPSPPPAQTDAGEGDVAEGAPRRAPRLTARAARAEGTLAHGLLEHVDADHFGGGGPSLSRELSRGLARDGVSPDSPAHDEIVARVSRFLTGTYAQRIRARGARILRELSFALSLPDASSRTLALRGTIDLLVVWPAENGAPLEIDVIDYKRARGLSAEPHAFQLGAYALAAREQFPDAAVVRAGIVFLGGEATEPSWWTLEEPTAARARLAKLAGRLVDARWSEAFPRVTIDRCRAIRCGYVMLCHPEEKRAPA